MKSSTVRIDSKSRDLLHELAERESQPQSVVLKHALEEYRRKRFLERCGTAYANLRARSKAWHAEQSERDEWDEALADGIERDS